jgi:ABC-type transport system substrate-binding protein
MPAAVPLTIHLSRSGTMPSDIGAPVLALASFNGAVLGQNLRITETYGLAPGLVSAWSWDYVEQQYRLEIAPDARFHNGRPVTAADLEFSLARWFCTPRSTYQRTFLANIAGAEEVRPDTPYHPGIISGLKVASPKVLLVKMATPNPAFLYTIARPTFSVVPREALADDYVTWKDKPIGAGPYEVVAMDRSRVSITVAAVPGVALPERTPRSAIFLGSAADEDADIELDSRGRTGNRIWQRRFQSERPMAATYMLFNFRTRLGADRQFRRAIAAALDSFDLVLDRPGFRPLGEMLPSPYWGRLGIRNIPSNRTQARTWLAELGAVQPPGKEAPPLRLPVLGFPLNEDWIVRLVAQLEAAGLAIQPEVSTSKTLAPSEADAPFKIMSFPADDQDPLVLLSLLRDGSPLQGLHPDGDETYQKLFRAASTAQPLDVRVETVRRLSRYIAEEHLILPLFERRGIYSINDQRIASLGVGRAQSHLDLTAIMLRESP